MRSPGGATIKRTMPVAMEDLDQDFAFEIFENFQRVKELIEDVSKLKQSETSSKDLLVDFLKEQ